MTVAPLLEKLPLLWPEIAMATGACLCLFTGLSPQAGLRKATAWITALTLLIAGLLVLVGPPGGDDLTIAEFTKLAVVLVGLILLLVAAQLPQQWRSTQSADSNAATFDPGNVFRGEFFAFFLFSLMGVMLCAGANDLVWLFLALELTSLPTYVMVAMSRDRVEAQEAAVKYFFLGTMSAAIFLYGFSLIYGVSGTTQFYSADPEVVTIARYVAEQTASNGVLPPMLTTGLLLAVVGIAFKIAAVPMHFYTPDVYQGAAIPVTAFLAFVPKTAGFVSLILLLRAVGWPLPEEVSWLLWIMAALTMTVGNVLGLLQSNVKRVLAYSSIAHSGYMLVGLVAAGPPPTSGQAIGHGAAAVLFYLVAYGLATIGAFAVLGCLRAHGEEAQTYDDISGLSSRRPVLAAVMLISVLSLTGLPPTIGFVGKIYLFGSAVEHGFLGLVVLAVVNSAVSAVYYLRIVGVCYFGQVEALPTSSADMEPTAIPPAPKGLQPGQIGATIAAVLALCLGLVGGWLVDAAHRAAPTGSETGVAARPPDHASSQSDDTR